MNHFLSLLVVLLCSSTFICDELVRLVNIKPNGHDMQGDVEIFYNDMWRPLCSRGWYVSCANVVCKTIGFSQGAVGIKYNELLGQPKRRHYYYQFLGLGCTGNETVIEDCPNWNKEVFDIRTCAHGIAIAVCKR